MIVSVDYRKDNGTVEVLVAELRVGSRTANKAKVHIRVFSKALGQLSDTMYDEHGSLSAEQTLMRTASAGASRESLHHLHPLGMQFSNSFALPVTNEHLIHWIDDKEHCERALDRHENERHDAWVINATQVIKLKDYPEGTRLYLRAEPLHPGAQSLALRRAPRAIVPRRRPVPELQVPGRPHRPKPGAKTVSKP